jgi:hypothetical protein
VPADERADLLAVLTHSGVSRPTVRRALAPLMQHGMRIREALEVLAAAPRGRSLARMLLDRVVSTDALVAREIAIESAAMACPPRIERVSARMRYFIFMVSSSV